MYEILAMVCLLLPHGTPNNMSAGLLDPSMNMISTCLSSMHWHNDVFEDSILESLEEDGYHTDDDEGYKGNSNTGKEVWQL